MLKIAKHFTLGLMVMWASWLMSSCQEEDVSHQETALVTLSVQHFDIYDDVMVQSDKSAGLFAKDATASDATENITVAIFDAVGNVVYNATQTEDDSSTYDAYGSFQLRLGYGTYTLVVVGYGTTGTTPETPVVISSPTLALFPGPKIPDCLVAQQTFSVTTGGTANLQAVLTRQVARFSVTDPAAVPSNVDSITIAFATGSKSFNPTTGLANNSNGYTRGMGVTAAHGQTNHGYGAYLFLNSDEQLVDVAVTFYDAQGNVNYRKTLDDVYMKRNRHTRAVGSLYSSDADAHFTYDNAWLSDTTIHFQ